MKIGVSYDSQGRIVALIKVAEPDGGKDGGTHTYVPKPGEHHHVMDVPKEFHGKSLIELQRSLRVNTDALHPALESWGK